MKARNEARAIERALSRAVSNARDALADPEQMANFETVCNEYAHLPAHEHAMRGYLLGLNEARNIVKRDHLRRPRRRINS